MKLLVSPKSVEEAKAAIKGGADIIDVKNPKEGSLGANFPWVIKEIKDILPSGIELSAALGDLNFKPGTASLAAYGAVSLGVDYIKAGFLTAEKKEARELANKISNAVRNFNAKVVLAGYADYKEIGSISPFILPEVAGEEGAHVVMIDTARKEGRGLLDYLNVGELEKFIQLAHEHELKAALAGSLKIKDIKLLKDTDADIIGVRSLVCIGDRINGRISAKKVRELKEFLRR
ncbi:MAG: (5-formylfuran-3-yl)methyl phosphate synthase [Euryarchaeota archaeon]|nr:(5-formylfuran-3-yl)methyl phosphate synthase [Euryarchaeota archaeon]